MPLDGMFIHKLVDELQIIKNLNISKIYQFGQFDFLFYLNNKKSKLVISVHPEFYRMHLSEKNYEPLKNLTQKLIILRKYLEGGRITNLSQYLNDRIIILDISNHNDLGDIVNYQLIIELIGKSSNLILTKDNLIIDCIKTTSPFEQNRLLLPNAKYTFLDNQKLLNPFNHPLNIKEIINIEDKVYYLLNTYQGMSKIIALEIISQYPIETSYNRIINAFNPTIINQKIFSYLDLTSIQGERIHYETLSLLLDNLYLEKEHLDRIKQQSNNLLKTIKKQIEKNTYKISKLQEEISDAKNNNDKIKGDLIFNHIHEIPNKTLLYKTINYENNEMIEIPLDPKLSIKDNALKYYHNYQKKKRSLIHLPLEIEKAQNEIAYFNLLESQVMVGSLDDILEIIKELESANYLKEKHQKSKKKLTIEKYFINQTTIYVGKNNLQNAYLTHNLAHANDLWFHVKDAPSSHVVLQGEVTEETIRAAAMLTAYYSKLRYSCSIPIDYTQIRYVKKISGMKNCFVKYSNQKTIFIDINLDYLNTLKK